MTDVLAPDSLVQALAAIVGPGGRVVGDALPSRPASRTRPDEPCRAAALVRPRDTAEVSAVPAACHVAVGVRTDAPRLIIRGGARA